MKKTTLTLLISYLILSLMVSHSTLANENKEMKRTPYHFNIGYNLNKFVVGLIAEDNSAIQTPFGHGGQVAFDWQGKGRSGFQIPISYYYHPKISASEVDFGANWMIHINKRDKAFDPYFALGLKWVSGHAEGMSQNWAIMPIPFLNTGFGVRHFLTPSVGLYAEAVVSNLLFVVWEFEGRVGISFGF